MTLRALVTVVALVSLGVSAGAAAGAPSGPGGEKVKIIGVFHDSVGSPRAAAQDLERRHNGELSFVYEHAIKGFAGDFPRASLNGLSNDPRIDYIELDQIATIAAQETPTGVERVFADDNTTLDIDGVDEVRVDAVVAVLDTGIDFEHPDLNVNSDKSVSCFHSTRQGWKVTYSCGSGGDDDHYHGTHVAGSVGAIDNGIGVVGVAPGVELWSIKVLDSSGSGPFSVILAGVDYVTANKDFIDVANMSLGCECDHQATRDAINNAISQGVTFVVAAGNSGKDASTFFPANIDAAITVSALADFDGAPGGNGSATCRSDQDDTLADFSNYGSKVDVIAPGVCIRSTYPLERGEYGTISGTSMASPHAAGAAALLASTGQSPSQIRTSLVNTGNTNWTGDKDGTTERLIDVSTFTPATVAGTESSSGGSGPNRAPVASDDSYATDENTPLHVAAPGVLGNDSDDDSDPLTAVLVGGPSHGSLTLNANGSFSYTPDAGYFGPDSFTYKANDGTTDSGTATVTLTVNEVVDASPSPSGMHVADLDAVSLNGGGPEWTASVTITVHDASHNPVSGATVSGSWSTGGSPSCTTNTAGQCTVQVTLHKRNATVTFTVSGITHSSHTYSATDNHDPDSDSNGTSITAVKP